MVGFCHGGNLLGNHDDDGDHVDDDGDDDDVNNDCPPKQKLMRLLFSARVGRLSIVQ